MIGGLNTNVFNRHKVKFKHKLPSGKIINRLSMLPYQFVLLARMDIDSLHKAMKKSGNPNADAIAAFMAEQGNNETIVQWLCQEDQAPLHYERLKKAHYYGFRTERINKGRRAKKVP